MLTEATALRVAWTNVVKTRIDAYCSSAAALAEQVSNKAECNEKYSEYCSGENPDECEEEFGEDWRYVDGEWIYAEKSCENERPCGDEYTTASYVNLFGADISRSDSHENQGVRCSDKLDECSSGSCAYGSEDICCCGSRAGWASCSGDSVDADCTTSTMALIEYDVCPSGVLTTVWSGDDLDFASTPNLALEALLLMDPLFRAINAGNVTIENTTCEMLIFEPRNSGRFVIDGSDDTSVMIVNPTNEPPANSALDFKGGQVRVFGGLNLGPGPIVFDTSLEIVLAELVNSGTVVFTDRAIDASVLGVTNMASGSISFEDSKVSIYDTSNAGNLTLAGGEYAWFGGQNTGDVNASSMSAVVDIDSNTGSFYCENCVLSLTVATNTGDVTIIGSSFNITVEDSMAGNIDLSDAGNVGTLTYTTPNSGTISVGPNVEVVVLESSDDSNSGDPSPTPSPTMMPTLATYVASSLTVSGMTVAEATAAGGDVFTAAIADVAEVEESSVTIDGYSIESTNSSRRRLLDAGDLVVDYRIAASSSAAATALVTVITATTASEFDTALVTAASGASAFASVTTTAVYVTFETFSATAAPTVTNVADDAQQLKNPFFNLLLATALLAGTTALF